MIMQEDPLSTRTKITHDMGGIRTGTKTSLNTIIYLNPQGKIKKIGLWYQLPILANIILSKNIYW